MYGCLISSNNYAMTELNNQSEKTHLAQQSYPNSLLPALCLSLSQVSQPSCIHYILSGVSVSPPDGGSQLGSASMWMNGWINKCWVEN